MSGRRACQSRGTSSGCWTCSNRRVCLDSWVRPDRRSRPTDNNILKNNIFFMLKVKIHGLIDSEDFCGVFDLMNFFHRSFFPV